jgi:hypothetical protein
MKHIFCKIIMYKGKLGSFDLWGSFINAFPFIFAHDLPTFLYFSIAGKFNLMIRFKSKGHGSYPRYFILNGKHWFV